MNALAMACISLFERKKVFFSLIHGHFAGLQPASSAVILERALVEVTARLDQEAQDIWQES